MNAILLCPGPSLALPNEIPHAELVVGVNRAACRFPCSIWAATDYPMIRDFHKQVLGQPSLFTRRQTWIDTQRFPAVKAMPSILIEDMVVDVPMWAQYTAPAALGLLAVMGAKRVDVYGADWTDAPDFDGLQQPGTDRTEPRWERERGIWQGVVEWSGMNVIRH